jgi:endoglucanase
MRYLKAACAVSLAGVLLAMAGSVASGADSDAVTFNRLLGRGMNIGNALDAPREGAWGVTLKEEYFQALKDAGFNSVRIPIRWSAHAESNPPYAIDPAFFARVDWAIDQALSRGLTAVINVHHYIAMDEDPVVNAPRLVGLWKEIAGRYQNRPSKLFFELFNEPQDKLSDEQWNDVIPDLLRAIRETNPTRMVIVGPGYWNGFDHLPSLQIPEADRGIIVTFHYYKPIQFTHQAQSWMPSSAAWKGTKWGSAQDHDVLRRDFDSAASWAREHRRPLYLGEFGASENADLESRVSWTSAVAREAEHLGFSWSYWQLCSSFAVYDCAAGSWNQAMLRALLDKPGE